MVKPSRRNLVLVAICVVFATASSTFEALADPPYVSVQLTIRNQFNETVNVVVDGYGVVGVSRTLRPGETWVARTRSNALTARMTVSSPVCTRQARPTWGHTRKIVVDRATVRTFKIVQ